MSDDRDWTYYTYGGLEPGDHISYLRYWGGVAERLNTDAMTWVPTDGLRISRYLERGEIALDKTTRQAVEAAVGKPLPDGDSPKDAARALHMATIRRLAENRRVIGVDWTYYALGGLIPKDPFPVYLRYRGGVAEVLNPASMTWGPGNGRGLEESIASIESVESLLTETTRKAIEAAVGSPLPPDTITVTVRDRSSETACGSPGYRDPVTRTITIDAYCPVCGQRRGEPFGKNEHDDGARYSVQGWENPCGHKDTWVAVLEEARELAEREARS